jgi:diguanylate cyclase (GGDEF)-like protein
MTRFTAVRPGRSLMFLFTCAIVFVLGFIDYVTGSEYSFSIFYLIPVTMAAWSAGAIPGLVVSAGATVAWYLCNQLNGQVYSSQVVPLLNMATRLVFFMASATIVSRLRLVLDREKVFSRTDILTGIFNRTAFYDLTSSEIERLRRYKRVFTVVYIDLDNFKTVNDSYGHAEGDALLKAIAETIQASLRPTDVLARMGGDEFMILLPETGAESAQIVIERLRTSLAERMLARSYAVTLSMGVVTCSVAPPSVDKLINLADEQMYVAKKSGKNDIRSLVYMN